MSASKLFSVWQARNASGSALDYDTWLQQQTFRHVGELQRRLGVDPDEWFGPGTLSAALRGLGGAPNVSQYGERIRVPPQPAGYGLAPCRQSTQMEIFGAPGVASVECSEPLPAIAALMVTRQVHPSFRVRGLGHAVTAVQRALDLCKIANPELYELLGTAGMLCVRRVRDGKNFSNHAWGTAIDVKIADVLDAHGDGWCQRGLWLLEPHFRAVGFYWGAWFSREDAMHFEASDQLVREWRATGAV